MALPNPFNCSSVSQINTVSTPSNRTLNPGPGLPQALQPNYSNSYIPKPNLDNKSNSLGCGRNPYSSSQYMPFSCDRCDRSFKTKELLDFHISEHVVCGLDGCNFYAHPKIVEKHIQMQHETGMASMIMKLNTPEEIQKWKEERKKNFPTGANVARRQAEQKEKLGRGEVLFDPKKRFGNRGNPQQQRGRGRGKRGGNQGRIDRSQVGYEPRKTTSPTSQHSASSRTEPTPNSCPSEKPAEHVKQLSDGEIDSDTETPQCVKLAPTGNALANLMGCYASDSNDEQNEDPVCKKAKIAEEKKPQEKESNSGKNTVNQTPKAGEETKKEPLAKKRGPKRRNKGKGGPTPQQMLRPKRLTLLQKLLQGEIMHERNVILQCVHYIVQQNFFGIGNEGKLTIPPPCEVANSTEDSNETTTLTNQRID